MTAIREFAHRSADYEQAWHLRERVLRLPLGMHLLPADRERDAAARHFGLFEGSTLLACLIALPENEGRVARIRQVAVNPARQGEGLGRRLMEAVEASLRQDGVARCRLHARAEVADFYRALGYSVEGTVFEEIGIPHYPMGKALRPVAEPAC